jgi:ectoine hydroxylase-related dioxygenase (phytanoyl-CoA dioxygenase family)
MRDDHRIEATDTDLWLTEDFCRLEDLIAAIDQSRDAVPVRFAAAIDQGVPIYDGAGLRRDLATPHARTALKTEWVRVLMDGAGILVLKGAYPDAAVVDRATAVFQEIIAEQRASGAAAGDHFAKPGANDRIWNALEKLCLRAPEIFAAYYANDLIALVCETWLGPAYQITSQINVVNPGGAAQAPHRDYHLGFMTPDQIAQYPAHVHRLSPVLTLQGAVAHCSMPVDSGPTQYLPGSQRYAAGYLAWRRDDIRRYFAEHFIQLPLETGDAVFFNPALLHAAGDNRSTDVVRMANLLQVSSAFGRAMESVDRTRMSAALYPVLRTMAAAGSLDATGIDNAVSACAEGYSFPTNLDRDPPVGGLAPETQQALMRRALTEGWKPEAFEAALTAHAERRRTA